jgi:F-type H+-transporting ATPase subunit b
MNEFFQNNLVNWLILVGVVSFMWMKFMPGVFGSRRQKIQTAIDDAQRAKKEGGAFLAEQRERIANAEKEAERILIEARQVAEQIKQQTSEKTKTDVEALEKKLDQQIATHRQMVITELRSQAATAAVRLAEASLPGAITPTVKKGLQERFVTQLDQLGANK